MKSYFKILLVVLLLALPAFSQRRLIELDNLNKQIKTVQELLRTSPNADAEQYVRQAEKIRDEAVQLLSRQRNGLAMNKIRVAGDLVSKAVNLLSETRAGEMRDQVDELIRTAEQLLAGKSNTEAERLLGNARESRTAAGDYLTRNDNQNAKQEFRLAKLYAERCINLLQGLTPVPGTNLQDEQARFEELLQRAEKAVANCANERARNLVGSVREQRQNIEQARQTGNEQVVRKLYNSNTRLLLRAIDLCQGRDSSLREQAIEEVELLGDLLKSVQEQQNNGQAPSEHTFVQRAGQFYRQALAALDNKNYNRASRQAAQGRIMLSRLWSGNNRESMEQKARGELEQLAYNVEQSKTDPAITADPQKSALLQAARISVDDAGQFLQKGRIRLALEAIYAGNRYLSAITVSGQAATDQDAEILQNELKTLRDSIELFQKDKTLNETAAAMLAEAHNKAQAAALALEQHYLQLARENIDLGSALVEKIKSQ